MSIGGRKHLLAGVARRRHAWEVVDDFLFLVVHDTASTDCSKS
jgi:hypothetical protein